MAFLEVILAELSPAVSFRSKVACINREKSNQRFFISFEVRLRNKHVPLQLRRRVGQSCKKDAKYQHHRRFKEKVRHWALFVFCF